MSKSKDEQEQQKRSIDGVELELFRNSLLSIADEMALTIHRTAYSGVLKDNMDYSTALFDGRGRLVAQGLTLPAHLGSMPTALEGVIRRYPTIKKGDAFILNDPYAGGMHLPDIFVFLPVVHDHEVIAFAGTVCHHTDIGGRVAGSNASDSTEIYQEGLRIPPTYLCEQGVMNETLVQLLTTNVRIPGKVLGDLRAQLAACHIGEQAVLELARRVGHGRLAALMDETLDHAERMTRAAIRALPDGEFDFSDYIDDDGVDVGQPIPVRVKVLKSGDNISVDWTGSSKQVTGAINCTLSFTKSSSYCAIKCILDESIPSNEGVFRAIEVIAPKGTITNATLPAACAARGLSGYRMIDCLFGALSKMLPHKVFAACDGGNSGVSIGGYDQNLQPFIFVDFTCGAWGARPYSDGLDGNANISVNMAAQSVEVIETEHPVQILAYEYICDAMGAGKYRGGAPSRRTYRFLEERATLQMRSDRRTFAPYGLYGGHPGRPSFSMLNPQAEREALPSKFIRNIRRGDVLVHEIAGGGGWGDPLERAVEAVEVDVRNGFISERTAREKYGVVLVPGTSRADRRATQALRERLGTGGPAQPPHARWEVPKPLEA